VLSVRRSTGVAESVEMPFVVVICSALLGVRGIRSLDCNLEIIRRSDNDEALTRLFGQGE
jgi:hypothetical protein